jgi:hypothetical protein
MKLYGSAQFLWSGTQFLVLYLKEEDYLPFIGSEIAPAP